MSANKILTTLILIVAILVIGCFIFGDQFKKTKAIAVDNSLASTEKADIGKQSEAIENQRDIAIDNSEEISVTDTQTELPQNIEQVILDRQAIVAIAKEKSIEASGELAGYESLLTPEQSDNGAVKITAGKAYRLTYTTEETPIALALDYPGLIKGCDKPTVSLLGENGAYQQLDSIAQNGNLQTNITLGESMRGKFFIHIDRSVQFPLSPNRYLLLVE
jgi:hypothetical protein